MIKLVAIDIDGTLVNEKKMMTEPVQQAIRQAAEQGVKMVLCTGRPIQGIQPYMDELGFFDKKEEFAISHNGACITRTDTLEVVDDVALSSDELREIYAFSKNYPPLFTIMNEERFIAVGGEVTPVARNEARVVNMELEEAELDDVVEKDRFLKVVYIGTENDLDVLESVMPAELRERYYVVRSQTYLLEIMVKGTNKGTALRKLAEHLGFTMDEVMAIGDGENDYEMIHAAGIGIGMENGTERVKSIANDITLSNEADGVAHALEKWVLNQN